MSAVADELVGLLGRSVSDPQLTRAFERLPNPWLPKIEPPERHDWIVVGNVELGFEAAAHFHAYETATSPQPPVLEQVCFYTPSSGLRKVNEPPFGLRYGMARADVRHALAPLANASRLRKRDVFELGALTAVIGYTAQESLDSVLVLASRGERVSLAEPPLGFREIAQFFGRTWYDDTLRSRLYALTAVEGAVAQIKKHGTLDLVAEAGVRLLFLKTDESRVLNGVEIYRSRVNDAPKWASDLPLGIEFTDSITDVSCKLGSQPQSAHDEDLEGRATWARDDFRIVVVFDLIVNLIASITVAGAERWSS